MATQHRKMLLAVLRMPDWSAGKTGRQCFSTLRVPRPFRLSSHRLLLHSFIALEMGIHTHLPTTNTCYCPLPDTSSCPEYVTAGTLVLGYDLHVFSPSHPFEPQVHRMTPLPKASKAIIRKASTCLRYPLGNLSRLSLKRIFLTKRVIAAKSPTELRRRVCGSSTNTTITMTGPARSLGGAPSGPYPCQRALNGSRHGEVEPRRRR
ncbi:hypothetical protein BKA56DRAFT_67283 [Ilyonectria sp. MPI-CAGE-AT-0026]|nr:hypothetical protein BKA56DRAFT_67283 [Ilyonectria sp. MPI-CAGE-AT-0026]